MIEPDISIYFVRPIIRYLRTLGLENSAIFRKLALTEAETSDNSLKIQFSRMLKILEKATAMTNSCNIGLHIYDDFDLTQFGQFGYLMMTSTNLLEGFKAASEYSFYVDESTNAELLEEDDHIELVYSHSDQRFSGHPQDIIQTLMFFVAYIRTYVDSGWYPQKLELQFSQPPKKELEEYHAVLGEHLYFDHPVNRLLSDKSVFLVPLPASDRNLNELMTKEIQESLHNASGRIDFMRHLSKLIEASLSTGSKIEDIAKQINYSTRSLQRQLAEWDYQYRDIVEYVRMQKAMGYLKSGNHTVNEIASFLGYSEGSAFIRAFRRWSGKSPLGYLKAHRHR